eukprot:1906835-Pleurochrysis_carterae.AAC.1
MCKPLTSEPTVALKNIDDLRENKSLSIKPLQTKNEPERPCPQKAKRRMHHAAAVAATRTQSSAMCIRAEATFSPACGF